LPPYTKLPRPAGFIEYSYNPMSPPNWGIAASDFHVLVYPSVRIALQALLQATTTIQAQRLEEGTAVLLGGHLLFRGHSDVTQRLIPTRLRARWKEPAERERIPIGSPRTVKFGDIELPEVAFRQVAFDAGSADPRDEFGDWYERIEPWRSIEESLEEVQAELPERDEIERAALQRAAKLPQLKQLDPFRRKAVVRHYSKVPSPLLDVSTSPEVAAFFATGGASRPAIPGKIGMLWAIDLNFLADLFSLKITSIPGGELIRMTEQREKWGDNREMFEEYGVLPTQLEINSVNLDFHRPLAQHAQFVSLAGDGGAVLPPKTELTWWSIIERRAAVCAFIQDGTVYENADKNITAAALWPDDDPLANALP